MPGTQSPPYGDTYLRDECRGENVPCTHFDEQQHTLVSIMRTTLSDTKRIIDHFGEWLQGRINFCGAKANATGIENAVTER